MDETTYTPIIAKSNSLHQTHRRENQLPLKCPNCRHENQECCWGKKNKVYFGRHRHRIGACNGCLQRKPPILICYLTTEDDLAIERSRTNPSDPILAELKRRKAVVNDDTISSLSDYSKLLVRKLEEMAEEIAQEIFKGHPYFDKEDHVNSSRNRLKLIFILTAINVSQLEPVGGRFVRISPDEVTLVEWLNKEILPFDEELGIALQTLALGPIHSEVYWLIRATSGSVSREVGYHLLLEAIFDYDIDELDLGVIKWSYRVIMRATLEENAGLQSPSLYFPIRDRMSRLKRGIETESAGVESNYKRIKKALQELDRLMLCEIIVGLTRAELDELISKYASVEFTDLRHEVKSIADKEIGKVLGYILDGCNPVARARRDAILIHDAITDYSSANSNLLLTSRLIRAHWHSKHLFKIRKAFLSIYKVQLVDFIVKAIPDSDYQILLRELVESNLSERSFPKKPSKNAPTASRNLSPLSQTKISTTDSHTIRLDMEGNGEDFLPSQNIERNNDRKSIISEGASISSKETAKANQLDAMSPATHINLYIMMLYDEDELRHLLDITYKKLKTEKVDRFMKSLFKRYSFELQESAKMPLEVIIAELIMSDFHHIAPGLKELMNSPEQSKASYPRITKALDQGGKSKYNMKGHSKQSVPIESDHSLRFQDYNVISANTVDTKGPDPDVGSKKEFRKLPIKDNPQYPSLNMARKFLVEGEAFTKLLVELEEFSGGDYPDPGTVEKKLPADDLFNETVKELSEKFIFRQSSKYSLFWSILNSWKLYFDSHQAESPVSFWPLSQPRRPCKEGFTRLYWDCPCDIEMCIDVPTTNTDNYMLHTSTAKQVQLPSGTGHEQGSTSQKSQYKSHLSSDSGESQQHSHPQIAINTTPIYNSPYRGALIFWCTKETPLTQLMKNIEVNHNTSDENIFTKFSQAYRQIRGWRRYFSLTAICDIRYVRFNRIGSTPRADGYCSNFVVALPPPPPADVGYESPYQPLPPLEGSELLRHFHNPGMHADPECTGHLLKLMPRRIAGPLPRQGRPEAYGLQAVEGKAPLKVAILIIGIYLITTIPFAAWWLQNHPSDLQNALQPGLWLMALIVTLLNVPGIYEAI